MEFLERTLNPNNIVLLNQFSEHVFLFISVRRVFARTLSIYIYIYIYTLDNMNVVVVGAKKNNALYKTMVLEILIYIIYIYFLF